MSIYAIGDVQGCFAELQALLNVIQFNPSKDTLWFTGDLVNRGPDSLAVLRFVKGLGKAQISILGNHDLHLLALFFGKRKLQAEDTLAAILEAPDRDELLSWLQHLPLFYHDKNLNFSMVHAGLAPSWSIKQAALLAAEVETAIRKHPDFFFEHMYGDLPDLWREDLEGIGRLRCIVNYFTRMRFCNSEGRMDLTYKGEIAGKPSALMPWFDVPNRVNVNDAIIFGHWAALNGKTTVPNVFALDTGCVWGNCLTAMRLDDQQRFTVPCHR